MLHITIHNKIQANPNVEVKLVTFTKISVVLIVLTLVAEKSILILSLEPMDMP